MVPRMQPSGETSTSYFIIIVITMSANGDLMMGDSLTQQLIDNVNMDVMFVMTLRSSTKSPFIYF